MKIFTKKQTICLLIVFAMLFNFVPINVFTSKVYAKTAVSEIRVTGATTSVQAGELPEFTVSLEQGQEHIQSIHSYGSNTRWMYKTSAGSAWKGFGTETPTAVDNGTTHYGLCVSFIFEDGYELDENTKIYYNGVDVTNQGYSRANLINNSAFYIDLTA